MSTDPSATPSGQAPLNWPRINESQSLSAVLAGRNILLPFDRSAQSGAACHVAAAIAEHAGAGVHVVSVIDTTPVPIPFPLGGVFALGSDSSAGMLHGEQENEIREAVGALLGHEVDWPTSIELGRPAGAIARRAKGIDAALIVMGLARHSLPDRLVHDETTLSVMRDAECPVLGVIAGVTCLPRKALVAMDFTLASVGAAMMAAQLMSDGGTMTLAFVESMIQSPPDSADAVIHRLGLAAAFARLTTVLESSTLRVDHVVLHHSEPVTLSKLLLEHATEAQFDLLVAGSARHGRLDRILLGSVSADLVRAGQCSTLIVPPPRE